jgi:hypothetical protein
MKTGTLLAIILFALVAVAHLIRLVDRTEVVVGTTVVPLWVSVLGVVVPGLLAWLLWRESK